MEGNIPSPNFEDKRSSGGEDFVGFSSTPIGGKNFKPKWGKKNRNQNWSRFGQHQQQDEGYSFNDSFDNSFNSNQANSFNSAHNDSFSSPEQRSFNSPQHNSSYNQHNNSSYSQHNNSSYNKQSYYPQQNNSYRGRGGWRGNNRSDWGNNSPYRGGQPRHRGRGGHTPGYHPGDPGGNMQSYTPTPKSQGYYHPEMLRDPWVQLEKEMGWREGISEGRSIVNNDELDKELKAQEEAIGWKTVEDYKEYSNDDCEYDVREDKREFSESMIPQVGDTLIERNNELLNESNVNKTSEKEEDIEETDV